MKYGTFLFGRFVHDIYLVRDSNGYYMYFYKDDDNPVEISCYLGKSGFWYFNFNSGQQTSGCYFKTLEEANAALYVYSIRDDGGVFDYEIGI